MEDKIKLRFYIKACTFLLLTLICNFYDDKRISYTCSNEKNNIDIKLFARNYRLLAKNKQGTCSNIVWIKEEIPNNAEYKKYIPNNEKVYKEKNKTRNECSLNNLRNYGEYRRSKFSLHNRENSYSKKRMLDKIYYKNKVRDIINADFKFLRKNILQELKGLCASCSLIMLSGAIYLFLKFIKIGDLSTLKSSFIEFRIGNGTIVVLILGLIVLIALIYIGRKIFRDVKLTYKKCELNNTAYPSFRKVFFL
ncbi:uncharacterized protein MKS88_000234 [Plasmodium brasilianum]|uniref:uncharacterized protein n=1 Tax=Plasmodium brasilianum TaxID=5824 RepID=UPI00350E4D81|nr:hypothetical protein MKS88_000234 [Plasmodium brasilianum]